MWADFLDCTDGQLARLTGKKSKMGRILDGLAGFTWFVPIYLGIVYRFYYHHDIEFGWLGIEDTPENTMIATAVVLVLSVISGFMGMGGQQRLADYYIQIQTSCQRTHLGMSVSSRSRMSITLGNRRKPRLSSSV